MMTKIEGRVAGVSRAGRVKLNSHDAPRLPALRISDLTVEASVGARKSRILDGIDLEIAPGRTLGLVGESGAGKSMIGRLVARELPKGFNVVSGSVFFEGQDLLGADRRTHAGWLGNRLTFIPQEPMAALNPVLTVESQFSEHIARAGVAPLNRRARVIEALEEVLLPSPESLLDKYPFQLSGGMCQRILIAMAFFTEPALVIADEATTALDVSTQAHIVSILRRMQGRRKTAVLFVTHDLGLAAHACDDIAVLYAGQIMERGPARQLLTEPRHPYTVALRNAVPPLWGPMGALPSLKGQMPSVGELAAINGCRFTDRCRYSVAACSSAPPALEEIEAHQAVSCVRAKDVDVVQSLAMPPVATAGHESGAAIGTQISLEVKGLTKTYVTRKKRASPAVETHALRPIDLTLAPGEFVGVVGESGSGKSTLAKLIMGLETPSDGEILLNGRPLSNVPADWERRIASIQMIFQDSRAALNPRRRVGNILTQSYERRSHTKIERRRRARSLSEDVGLSPATVDRFPFQLSGGQRQRVNIGRTLCDVPQVLVADEIVSGLDVSVQAQIMNLLLELRKEHRFSLLLISHDLAVVRYLCSRVLVLREGEMVESGPTEQVLGNPRHPYTRALVSAVPPAGDQPWPTS